MTRSVTVVVALVTPALLADARDPFQHDVDPAELPPDDACAARDVTLCRLSLDELRLLGVVDGGDGPRAMVVGPNQRGTTLRRGMYVGRPDVMRTPQGMHRAFWRVARSEPGSTRLGAEGEAVERGAAVVFERVDPMQREGAPVERRVVASRGG
ncbi:MAG: hypothetical protein U0324_16125 [Polyangiales bacterium]